MSDFPPCPNCTAGNHDTCEALAPPFCGCRNEGHQAAMAAPAPAGIPTPLADGIEEDMTGSIAPLPVQAPMAEVLEAAARAPRSEVAAEQEVVAGQEGAVAPTTPAAAPVNPAALLQPPGAPSPVEAVMGTLAGALPDFGFAAPDDTEPGPEDDPTLDVGRGQVGLGAAPAIDLANLALVDPHGNVPEAAGPEDDTHDDPGTSSFIMAAVRPADAYLSLWDTGRATLAGEDTEAETTPPGIPEPDLVEIEDHSYAGSTEAPYACACGANPGSLNKLGSHMGITGNAAAMAALGAETVPHVVAHGNPPAAPHVNVAQAAVLPPPTVAVETALPPPPVADNGLPPGFAQALQDAMAADMGEGESIEITSDTPALPPAESWLPGMTHTGPAIDGPRTEVDQLTAPDGTPAEVSVEVLPPAEVFNPDWLTIFVDPETGRVALSTGELLPTDLADAILEHFDADPSPIDEDHPHVPAAHRPPPTSATARGLARNESARPQRVQVAKITTDCCRCTEGITPGQTIGMIPNVGWIHLSHTAA